MNRDTIIQYTLNTFKCTNSSIYTLALMSITAFRKYFILTFVSSLLLFSSCNTGHKGDITRLIKNNNYSEALNIIRDELAKDPKDAELYILKGICLLNLQSFTDAEDAFNLGHYYDNEKDAMITKAYKEYILPKLLKTTYKTDGNITIYSTLIQSAYQFDSNIAESIFTDLATKIQEIKDLQDYVHVNVLKEIKTKNAISKDDLLAILNTYITNLSEANNYKGAYDYATLRSDLSEDYALSMADICYNYGKSIVSMDPRNARVLFQQAIKIESLDSSNHNITNKIGGIYLHKGKDLLYELKFPDGISFFEDLFNISDKYQIAIDDIVEQVFDSLCAKNQFFQAYSLNYLYNGSNTLEETEKMYLKNINKHTFNFFDSDCEFTKHYASGQDIKITLLKSLSNQTLGALLKRDSSYFDNMMSFSEEDFIEFYRTKNYNASNIGQSLNSYKERQSSEKADYLSILDSITTFNSWNTNLRVLSLDYESSSNTGQGPLYRITLSLSDDFVRNKYNIRIDIEYLNSRGYIIDPYDTIYLY